MNIIKKVMNKINRILGKTPEKVVYEDYYNKYQSYSFADGAFDKLLVVVGDLRYSSWTNPATTFIRFVYHSRLESNS